MGVQRTKTAMVSKIDAEITANGSGAITGTLLNDLLEDFTASSVFGTGFNSLYGSNWAIEYVSGKTTASLFSQVFGRSVEDNIEFDLYASRHPTVENWCAIGAVAGASKSRFPGELGSDTYYAYLQKMNTTGDAGTGLRVFDTDEIIAFSTVATFAGIKYKDDYSANFVDRSLIDKGFGDATYLNKGTNNLSGALTFNNDNHIQNTLSWGIYGIDVNYFGTSTSFHMYNDRINIQRYDSSGNDQYFYFSPTGKIILRDAINSKGIEYYADYSANFTDLSLVNKGYTAQKTAKIILTSAEIKALNTTPKVLVPAPGVGKIVILLGAYAKYIYGTTAYTTNTLLGIYYGTAQANSNTLSISDPANRYRPLTSIDPDSTVALSNLPLNLWCASGNPAAGDGTVEITVSYIILDA